jgi:Protein of unknown function (DUF2786)
VERDDAIRKIRRLIAVADSPTAPDPERQSARDMAAKLRTKYGINDGDLTDADTDTDDGNDLFNALFGDRIFYYHEHVMPHLTAISREVLAAVAGIKKAGPEQRARMMTKFYADLRNQLDGRTYYGPPGVRAERDQAIKDYYWAYIDSQLAEDRHWAAEGGKKPFYSEGRDEPQLHIYAMGRLRRITDMRTRELEKIVGRTENELWEKQHRKHVCVACGLDGADGREMAGYYEWPAEQPDVDVPFRQRAWVHPGCQNKGSPKFTEG